MTQMPDVLTASQVAKLFGVDPRTVGRWAERHMIVFTTTGSGRRKYPSRQPLIAEHLAVMNAAGGQPAE